MKISEMTNDQAAEALLRISGPFAAIADDDELMALMDEVQSMQKSGMTVNKATVKMIPKFVAFGVKKHRRDFYEIIGALTGQTEAAVSRMNFLETVRIMQESYDEVFSGFFTRSGGARKIRGGKSSVKFSATDGTDGMS